MLIKQAAALLTRGVQQVWSLHPHFARVGMQGVRQESVGVIPACPSLWLQPSNVLCLQDVLG